MKYAISLTEEIEKKIELTEEEKEALNELNTLYCSICEGLKLKRKLLKHNKEEYQFLLENKYYEDFILTINKNNNYIYIEYNSYAYNNWKENYFICPFKAKFNTKPGNYELIELQFLYGEDVLLYQNSLTKEKRALVNLYTNIIIPKPENIFGISDTPITFDKTTLKPDYIFEISKKEHINNDTHYYIIYNINNNNKIKKIVFSPSQYGLETKSQIIERICETIADNCTNDLLTPKRRKRILPTK